MLPTAMIREILEFEGYVAPLVAIALPLLGGTTGCTTTKSQRAGEERPAEMIAGESEPATDEGSEADAGTEEAASQPSPERPELREELVEMRQKDQKMRKRILREDQTLEPDKENYPELGELDRRHAEQLAEIVDKVDGWPGTDVVGPEGADAAWMLAQHADHDVDFQADMLELLEQAVVAGQAPSKHLAYLTDRVRLNRGKKQLYGTQLEITDSGVEPKPIEDREKLDERRREMGLTPFEAYRGQVEKLYEQLAKN